MKRTAISYGASVRGPLHHREGVPNQDAWLRASGRFGSLIVVCDGMGSKPNARTGAQAACAAAREAVTRWSLVDGAPVSYLAHLVEVLWRLRLHPGEPGDAATTCLLAFVAASGQWVVGGVGDGLVATKTGEEPSVRVVGHRDSGFGNETSALGVSRGSKAWKLTVLPPTDDDRMAVLATDGVADDLIAEKLDAFCNWLVDDFLDLEPPQRWRRLRAELRDWPTPRHLDDKTVAVMKVPAAGAEEMS